MVQRDGQGESWEAQAEEGIGTPPGGWGERAQAERRPVGELRVSGFEVRARELVAALVAEEDAETGAGLAEELEDLAEAEGGSLGVSVGPTGEAVLGWRARAFGQAERDAEGAGFIIVGDVFDAGDEAGITARLDAGSSAFVAVSAAGVRFVWRPGVRVEGPDGASGHASAGGGS